MQANHITRRMMLVIMPIFLAIALVKGADAQQVLKFATIMPQGAPGDQEVRQVFRQVEKDTGGGVRIQTYAGGIAGDELDVIRKMKVNRIHMASFTGNGLGHLVPHVRVLETPNLFLTYGEEDYVKEQMFPEFARDFEKNGFVLLGLGGAGFVYVFSKHKITSLDIIKSLKMWTWKGDPLADLFARELGANMVPLHLADVNTGLQTGMIDSFYVTTMGCTALQWYSQARYMINYPVTLVSGSIVMTKRSFDQLPPEHRQILATAMRKSAADTENLVRELDAISLIQLRNAGIQFIDPSDELMKFFLETGERAVNRCVLDGMFSRELHNRVVALRDEYRRMHPGETWQKNMQEMEQKVAGKK